MTLGDPAGIGGEIILKSVRSMCRDSIPVIIGDLSVLSFLQQKIIQQDPVALKSFGSGQRGDVEFVDLHFLKNNVQPGVVSALYGEASYRYIIAALQLLFLGEVEALVTCPINKTSIRAAGIEFTGHTELLAHYGAVRQYIMMMVNRAMRVSLVTIHIPLKDVPSAISNERVFTCISITEKSLKGLFGIPHPRIKVCGLNPHAGEGGIMGNEEAIIEDAVSRAQSLGILVSGPYPADTLFHRIDCDCFIAMYHDQGLIPVKTTGFGSTVNITLGLPFVRTSPGHGTGYDIAGKGIADPSGLIEAYRLAEKLSLDR